MNGTNGPHPEPLIAGLAHVNLTIPRGTLDQAFDFYGNTLGLTSGIFIFNAYKNTVVENEWTANERRSPRPSAPKRHTCLVCLTLYTYLPNKLVNFATSRFNIADSGHMIHIAFNDTPNAATSTVSMSHPV